MVNPVQRLLSREEFARQVMARRRGLCAFCDLPAVDAHHILDRRLFPDGGYYLGNGAAVCESHHWECETTRLSVEAVWRACGIADPVLPPGFNRAQRYDKWGNRLRPDGYREAGPLMGDPGARRALARAGALHLVLLAGALDDGEGSWIGTN